MVFGDEGRLAVALAFPRSAHGMVTCLPYSFRYLAWHIIFHAVQGYLGCIDIYLGLLR